ncbi:MAG: LysM peptidoglycan-binding domain-containing protein [Proteobacteria bacterium]|nr:LysM peptidoglycan-binding domain-containing protein [Pseudomonadota bacterium]
MAILNRNRFANIGKVKRSTEEIVDDSIAKQGRISRRWRNHRPSTPAKPAHQTHNARIAPARSPQRPATGDRPVAAKRGRTRDKSENKSGIGAYWFPILCAIVILALLIWAIVPCCVGHRHAGVKPGIPEPTSRVVGESAIPTFDIVRIEKGGHIVAAGRGMANQSISMIINGKLVATERANARGEFVYSPANPLAPGNYVLRLMAVDTGKPSVDDVFLYVSPAGDENSVSLLMTKNGSTLLQAPKLVDGDLVVQKIDYLENDRIMVQGVALPRLRVTLTLDGRELGFSRVSDHKNFGLGAPVGALTPGKEYDLQVKLHDGDGRVVATVDHKFTMPEVTPGDETYYTVRRDDALWIIARNFLGRGPMYTLIVNANNIPNPDLIYPKQVLRIPVKGK